MQTPKLSSSQGSEKPNSIPPALQVANMVENKYLLSTNKPGFFPKDWKQQLFAGFPGRKIFEN